MNTKVKLLQALNTLLHVGLLVTYIAVDLIQYHKTVCISIPIFSIILWL